MNGTGTKGRAVTLGIAAAIAASLLFTGMDVCAKALPRLGAGEITFLRGAIGLLFLPFIARREGRPSFPAGTRRCSMCGASPAGWASCSFSSPFRG